MTYGVAASVQDAAGNSASASTSFATDFIAPTLTIDALPVGSVLDIVEQGAPLTITGTTTAEDGQTVTVNLNGQDYTGTASGGTWVATIPSSDLAALADSTGYTITAGTQDNAGNPATDATASLTTNFRPLLTIDPLGTNSAVALDDAQTSGLTISGGSVGLVAGQSVDVTLNSNSVGSTTVGADGSWTLSVPAGDFAALAAGDTLNFEAQASVTGGPDPDPVTDIVVAHVPAAFTIVEAGRSGSTVTFEVYADADADISSSFAVTTDLDFDPSVVTYDIGSEIENTDFDLFLVNSGGVPVIFGGTATSYSDLSTPVFTFTMTVQDPNQPIELTLTPAAGEGGPTRYVSGTGSNDTIIGSDIDDIIRGEGGDDDIDLSGVGRDILVIESDPTNNGTDTIQGFTLGPASDLSDALIFHGLDVSTLRGDGTGIETLNIGDTLDGNTGFVGLQTTLADLTTNSIETAVEGLSGAQTGDELYVLATDGTDSALVKVDYLAPGNASVETLALFEGLSDLNNLSADNILHTDPTGASA